MPATTPQIDTMLDDETDARFWAQYGWKPGTKLDPSNAHDRAFVPAWRDIRAKVKAEWAAGKLVRTADHPAVTSLLSKAADLFDHAAAKVAEAIHAVDPATKATAAAEAKAAHAEANAATLAAASYQPPTASPQLAQQAAAEIHADLTTNVTPISVRGSVDALQAAHAATHAATAAAQPPAPDAPQPPEDPSKRTAMIVAGCAAAAIVLAVIANGSVTPAAPSGYGAFYRGRP